jgi:hypothetical protein
VKRIPQKDDDEPLVISVATIQKKVAEEIKKPINSIEALEKFFASWWCRYYNRPYKSEELKNYSLEELIYEYYDVMFRNNPEALEQFLSGGKPEDAKEDEEWLRKMMGEQYMSSKEQHKVIKKTGIADLEDVSDESVEFRKTFS